MRTIAFICLSLDLFVVVGRFGCAVPPLREFVEDVEGDPDLAPLEPEELSDPEPPLECEEDELALEWDDDDDDPPPLEEPDE